jgi:hypothetical protein
VIRRILCSRTALGALGEPLAQTFVSKAPDRARPAPFALRRLNSCRSSTFSLSTSRQARGMVHFLGEEEETVACGSGILRRARRILSALGLLQGVPDNEDGMLGVQSLQTGMEVLPFVVTACRAFSSAIRPLRAALTVDLDALVSAPGTVPLEGAADTTGNGLRTKGRKSKTASRWYETIHKMGRGGDDERRTIG